MIKSITITNPFEEELEMVLTEPEKSGFIINSIDGLGPVKANVHMLDLATIDGGLDNGARLETRNIVLSLTFIGTPTIEDTRQKSYRFFPIKQKVTFKITTDNRTCYTVGRVESNVPTIFDEKEGCQISLVCESSYFYNDSDTVINFYIEEEGFEFPFENDSLEQGSKNLLINNLVSWIINDLQFIVNVNDTIAVKGQANKRDTLVCVGKFTPYATGLYKLYGCPIIPAGLADYIQVYVSNKDSKVAKATDIGLGIEFTISDSDVFKEHWVWISISKNAQLDVMFDPTVRKVEVLDNQHIEIGENLVQSNRLSWLVDDVDFKINDDGTISINGTTESDIEVVISDIYNIVNGSEYILSGCPSGGGDSTYRLEIIDIDDEIQGVDSGSGLTFTKTNYNQYNRVKIAINSGIILSNLLFKPMIRYSSVTDDSYEAYKVPIDNGKKISFGEINSVARRNVLYLGDAETGIKIEIHATGDASGVGIYNETVGTKMEISDTKLVAMTGSGLKAGDSIIINTNKGNKSIHLLRDGVYTNILNALIAPIQWFVLKTGDNEYIFDAATGLSNLGYNISYVNTYEGV